MFIIKYRKIWFTLSALLLSLSLWAMYAYGFNLSIDFVGGTITEVSYIERPEKSEVESMITQSGASVRTSGENNFIIRTKEPLEADLGGEVVRQNTIGPVAGAELRSKALKAVSVSVVLILLFIAFAFRKVSKPVSSWKYSFATIIALAHDVLIPTGLFVILGRIVGIEMDLLFVTGLLAILGYSVHDTIVVFDRIRENLKNFAKPEEADFKQVVGRSVVETMGRSINTTLTLVFMVAALYLLGSPATKDFSLLLLVGLLVGTYSSIFIASPLLVTFYKLQKK